MQVFAVLLLAGLAAAIPLDRRPVYVYDDAHYHRLGDFSSLPLSKYSIDKPVVTVSEDDLSTIYVDRALRDYPKYRGYNIPEDFAPQYDEVLASPLSEKVLPASAYEKNIEELYCKQGFCFYKTIGAPLSTRVLAAPLSEKVLSAPVHEKFIGAPLSTRVLAAPLNEKVLSAPVHEKFIGAPLSTRFLAAPLSEKVLSAPVHEKFIDAPLSTRVLAAPLHEKVLSVPSYEKVYTQRNVFAPSSELVDYPEKRYSTILEKSVPTAFYTLA